MGYQIFLISAPFLSILLTFFSGFQLQTVLYEDDEQCLRLIRNDFSKGYENILAMFIKPVVEFLVSQLTFVINNY